VGEAVEESGKQRPHELTMKNHHQCPIGMAPLSEVNYSSKGKDKVNGKKSPKSVGKFKKGMKNKHKKKKIQRPKFEKKERNSSSVIIVVVLIILQRSAIYPQRG
jgi:hypothetical protein